MSFWTGLGQFGQGFVKTYSPTAVGGAINQGLVNSGIDEANAAYDKEVSAIKNDQLGTKKLSTDQLDNLAKNGPGEAATSTYAGNKTLEQRNAENQAALEHLRNAQAKQGISQAEAYTRMVQAAKTRDTAIDDVVRKYKGLKGVADYHKEQAEIAKSDFENFMNTQRLDLAHNLQRFSDDPQFAFEQARGLFPQLQGATFDPKTNSIVMPNGQSTPVTQDMMSAAFDKYKISQYEKYIMAPEDFYKQRNADRQYALNEKLVGARVNELNARGERYGAGKANPFEVKNMSALVKEMKAYIEAGREAKIVGNSLYVLDENNNWKEVNRIYGSAPKSKAKQQKAEGKSTDQPAAQPASQPFPRATSSTQAAKEKAEKLPGTD